MKKLEFTRDVFASGFKAFSKGQQADSSPALQKHVRRGEAREIEVADPKPSAKDLTDQVYAEAVGNIVSGVNDLDYTVRGMSVHFGVDARAVRAELEKRLAAVKVEAERKTKEETEAKAKEETEAKARADAEAKGKKK